VDDRMEDLKAQGIFDPAIRKHVDKLVKEVQSSVREAAAANPRVGLEGFGFEMGVTGASEGCLRAASKAVLALASVPGSGEELVDSLELLRHLAAGRNSDEVWLYEQLGTEVDESRVFSFLQGIRQTVRTWPERGTVLLWDRYSKEKEQIEEAREDRQWAHHERLVNEKGRDAAHEWIARKHRSRSTRAGFAAYLAELDEAAEAKSTVTYEELIEAAKLLLACGDTQLGIRLEFADHIRPSESTNVSEETAEAKVSRDDPADFEAELNAMEEKYSRLSSNLRHQLQDLIFGWERELAVRLELERKELGGIVEFDKEARTLWVNNKGAKIHFARAIAAKVYNYLMGVIPAPYHTDAGRVGEGRKYNKRALALATALVNSIYFATYALPKSITEDQVRETHKSRFLS